MLEQEWGGPRWLGVYLLSGLVASLASCLALPDQITVGSR
jgi:membrane associated rhomboid family serine protease